MNDVSDYIMVTPQVVSPRDLEYVQTFCKQTDLWKPAGTIGNLKNYRTCSILNIAEIFDVEYHGCQKPEDLERVDRIFFDAAGEAARYYMEKFPNCKVKTDTGVCLLKYESGGEYKEHVDHHQRVPRSLSLSFSINDDYIGGRFCFFDGKYRYTATEGKAIVFPSNFMFPHAVEPIISGTRYSCVMWFL